MLLLLQIILCCLLYLALVKCAVRDSGRNCLYFYPDAYLDEAQKRGIADKTEELRKGKRFMTFFGLVIFVVMILSGAVMTSSLAWDISDTFNGLMSIPNLIALLLLSGTVVQLTRAFFKSEG